MRTDIGNARGKRKLSERNGIPRQKFDELLHVRISPFSKWWLKKNFESVSVGVRWLIERAVLEEAEGAVE